MTADEFVDEFYRLTCTLGAIADHSGDRESIDVMFEVLGKERVCELYFDKGQQYLRDQVDWLRKDNGS